MHKILIVGLTGGLATGKTSVAEMFGRLGAIIIDADKITHRLLSKGSYVYKRTILKFGKDILTRNKSIDRKKLADIIFANKGRLSIYQKIIHPEIKKVIRSRIVRIKKTSRIEKIIILDAPLLVEAGLHNIVDKLVVVKVNRRIQLLRLKDKSGKLEKNMLRRIKFQLPLADKIKLADYIINNSGELKYTEKQVKQVWKKIKGEVKYGHN